MKSCVRFSVLILLSLTLASSAIAATWYVDGTNGSDSNNCQTATSACKTITHAISLAASGDTIDIAAATYTGLVTIPVSLSLHGASPANTIIQAGPCGGTVVTIPVVKGSTLIVNISGVTITGGAPSCDFEGTQGGGILNSGNLTLTDSIVTGNKTDVYGGGINNGGTLTINKSTISNNTAGVTEAGHGGGVSCAGGTLRITNSTISGNSALGYNLAMGGGINLGGCPTTIISSTITGNSAALEGGAIFSTATLSINNTTISGNSYDALTSLSETKTRIQNSIIAGNTGRNCFVSSTFISNGYNISSDDTCNFDSTGDMNNTDPMLGALQNNGGPTDTMAIEPGSPAIDAGNPSGCTDGGGHLVGTDQRGDKRPGDPKLKTGCDMGAYEYQFPK
jgi:predicted outer membrane repeat protein